MNEIKSTQNNLQRLLLSDQPYTMDLCQSDSDFTQLCRTCLCGTTDNDLTNDALCVVSANGRLVRVYEMFEVVTGLKIEAHDKLPHHLCSVCLKSVNNSYTFRSQSQRADEILRGVLGSMKEEPNPIELGEHATEEEEKNAKEARKQSDETEGALKNETVPDAGCLLDLEGVEQLHTAPESNRIMNDSKFSSIGPTCKFCKKHDLIEHYKDKHPNKRAYKCRKCSASFRLLKSLQNHKITHLLQSKLKMRPQSCKAFHKPDKYKPHMEMHDEKQLYSCSECNKVFKQGQELRHHVLCHGARREQRRSQGRLRRNVENTSSAGFSSHLDMLTVASLIVEI